MVIVNKNIINIQKIKTSKCTTTENYQEREQERNEGNTKEPENN